jgi:hypothetical protein
MQTKTSKTTMICVRVPSGLVDRVDYVVRNTDSERVTNRSRAVSAALEGWTKAEELKLEALGIKKK